MSRETSQRRDAIMGCEGSLHGMTRGSTSDIDCLECGSARTEYATPSTSGFILTYHYCTSNDIVGESVQHLLESYACLQLLRYKAFQSLPRLFNVLGCGGLLHRTMGSMAANRPVFYFDIDNCVCLDLGTPTSYFCSRLEVILKKQEDSLPHV